jgi:hypothetical protein
MQALALEKTSSRGTNLFVSIISIVAALGGFLGEPYVPVDFEADPLWVRLKTLHQQRALDSLSERLFLPVPGPCLNCSTCKKIRWSC